MYLRIICTRHNRVFYFIIPRTYKYKQIYLCQSFYHFFYVYTMLFWNFNSAIFMRSVKYTLVQAYIFALSWRLKQQCMF